MIRCMEGATAGDFIFIFSPNGDVYRINKGDPPDMAKAVKLAPSGESVEVNNIGDTVNNISKANIVTGIPDGIAEQILAETITSMHGESVDGPSIDRFIQSMQNLASQERAMNKNDDK